MIYWIFCDWRRALLALGLAYDVETLVALTKKLRALDGAPDLVDVASAMRDTGANCLCWNTDNAQRIHDLADESSSGALKCL